MYQRVFLQPLRRPNTTALPRRSVCADLHAVAAAIRRGAVIVMVATVAAAVPGVIQAEDYDRGGDCGDNAHSGYECGDWH